MAIDLQNDELVDLAFARTHLIPKRNGQAIDRSTLHRWIRKGLKTATGHRIHLSCVYIGSTPMTTRDAIYEFFASLTEANRPIQDSEEHVAGLSGDV